jgi:hypothetical protein
MNLDSHWSSPVSHAGSLGCEPCLARTAVSRASLGCGALLAHGDHVENDAYTSWEWSTLCGELTKLEVDLTPANLIVLPVAKSETPETTAVSHQVFATRDQSEMISDA